MRAPRLLLCLLLALAAVPLPVRAQDPPPVQPPEEPVPGDLTTPPRVETLPAEPPGDDAPPESMLTPDEDTADTTPQTMDEDALTETEGPRIHALTIRSDTPIDRRELAEYLPFGVGDELTEDLARRTLKNLNALGLASRISLYTMPPTDEGAAEGSIEVLLVLWSNLLAEDVELTVTGDLKKRRKRRLQRDLKDELAQHPGEPLLENRVLRGDFQIEEELALQGYEEARVDLDVDVDDAANRATVRYEVVPGPRARWGEITFTGDLEPFTPERLRQALKIDRDDAYTVRRGRDAADRLQGFLIDEKYRTAQVERPTATYDSEARRMDLVFPVRVGPKITFAVEGADISKLRKQDLLPFLGDEGFDEALLLQAVERVETYFQEEGYYRAEVTTREEDTADGRLYTLVVAKGRQYTLAELDFDGLDEIDGVGEDTLRDLMVTSDSRFLGIGKARLVPGVLEDDLDNVRTYLALQGFTDYQVGPAEVDLRGSEIYVEIPIAAGRRRTLAEVTITGLDELGEGEARDLLRLDPDGPYHPRLVEDALENLRAEYVSRGFSDAQVSAEVTWNDEDTRAAVEVQVFEGPQQVLGRVLVRGNTRTRDYVIRRALAIESGDPVSRTRVLEMERNLYQLGIFSRVEVEMTPADLGTTSRDVVVRVEDGTVRSLVYGVGYKEADSDSIDQSGPRGFVGFNHRNVFGRGYRFLSDVNVEINNAEEQTFRIVFEQPYLKRIPIGLLYQLYRVDENQESYEAQRYIGRIEAFRQNGDLRMSLAYDYRLIEPDEFRAPLVLPEDIDDEGNQTGRLQPGIFSPLELDDEAPRDPDRVDVQVSSLVPGFTYDTRNDLLDPTRGYSFSAQAQYAFPVLEAEASFLELFVQHTNYLPIGKWGTLAGSLRLGAIEPLDTPAGAEGDKLLAIPLDERYFSGGRTSHRAFERLRLGDVGETLLFDEGDPTQTSDDEVLPIGGTGLALLNLEYRFPVFGAVGGTVFVDYGQIYRDWKDFDFGDLRPGAGVGIRYLSPIGPLRADIGFNLDRQPGESEYEIHLLFGNPF
jgi:outer membrane protein insertion porin family